MRAIIGITGQILLSGSHAATELHVTPLTCINMLKTYQVTPIVLINSDDERILNSYVELIDGLLIPGGVDIHPQAYGRPLEELTGAFDMHIDEGRDRTEMVLIRACIDQKKPILGICRGCQIMNVALGGTLTQHIGKAFPESHETHLVDPRQAGDTIAHSINIESNSTLGRVLGLRNCDVNSFHHQAVDDLGSGLRVVASSPDGICEAIEIETLDQFALGVQWHPEKMPKAESSQKIFAAFVNAVEKGKHES